MEERGPANSQKVLQSHVSESADVCPGVRPPSGPLPAPTFPMCLFADPDVVSLEAEGRPNFFLHVTANGSLELAKWQGSDAFRHHASFLLHQGMWRAGLVALESLAEPGSFLSVSGPVLALRPYEHTEVFRQGTLFQLLGNCLPHHLPRLLSPSLNCPSCPLSPYPSSCPQEAESSCFWHREAAWVPPLRWKVAWPPCWWPKELWAV